MPFPPIPKELYQDLNAPSEVQLMAVMQNINALFLYVQRLRDQSADEIATVVTADPTLGGTTFTDTSSIDFSVSSAGVSASVLNDSNIQKVEVADSGTLIGTRKRVNFIGGAVVADNPASNSVDITIASPTLSRVAVGTLTLGNTECIISSRYFEVQGILELNGDATLEVL